MQHGELVPTLHAQELNPHIDFEQTPFVVQRELAEWQRPVVEVDGAAGVAAHRGDLVVRRGRRERARDRRGVRAGAPAARASGERGAAGADRAVGAGRRSSCRSRLQQLAAALERRALGDADLADIAYTLQVGREAMEQPARADGELAGGADAKLQGYLAGEKGIEEFYRGEVEARQGHARGVCG